MQQKQKTKSEKCMMAVIAMAWVIGLLMAGSDNAHMPWTNGFGLLLFVLSSLLLNKKIRSSSAGTVSVSFSGNNQDHDKTVMPNAKSNQRMKIRYAQ